MLETMSQVKGAYSMVIMTEDSLLAFRDPHGFRPLCLGRLHSGYVLTRRPARWTWSKRNIQGSPSPGRF